jgi:uncharacterized protein
MELNAPLTHDELQELDNFLASDDVPEDCMDIAMLHGFLTAVAIGPALVRPSEWIPLIWGRGEPEFESLEDANHILQLITRLLNSTITILENDPEDFVPILYQMDGADGEQNVGEEEWCEGFALGMQLRLEEWKPALSKEQVALWLMPIAAFTDAEAMADFTSRSEGPRLTREDLSAMIPLCVTHLYDYWKENRSRRGDGFSMDQFPYGSQKTGRNDPCPCGSGKKYKRCCGAVQ